MSLALLFHYLLLNMFRMLVHPSSGACDLLWIYFICCIPLVRFVLVLRCGSAGVVWYPYAGWSSASACNCREVVVRNEFTEYQCCYYCYNTRYRSRAASISLLILGTYPCNSHPQSNDRLSHPLSEGMSSEKSPQQRVDFNFQFHSA